MTTVLFGLKYILRRLFWKYAPSFYTKRKYLKKKEEKFLAKNDLNTIIFSNLNLIYKFNQNNLNDLGAYTALIISDLQAVRRLFWKHKATFLEII